MQRDGHGVSRLIARPDGDGLVTHSGSAMLVAIAGSAGLRRALSQELEELKLGIRGHDLGRVVRDLAVMYRRRRGLPSSLSGDWRSGRVVRSWLSDATAFRAIDRIASDPGGLERLRSASARAQARVWELTGAPEVVDIDLDATLVGSSCWRGERARELQGRLRVSPNIRHLCRSDR